MIDLCWKCGQFYHGEHKECKPKTMLEYRTETYEKDKELGVW